MLLPALIVLVTGADLIKSGQQDIVIAGGGEDEHWSSSSLFDAMGALSSNFNETSGSLHLGLLIKIEMVLLSQVAAGMLVLEEEEHAKKRGANILANFIRLFC